MLKSFFVFLLVSLTFSLGSSQAFVIELSQPYYITGQQLSFAVFPAKKIAVDSMLIFVELYSPGSILSHQQIYRLASRSIHGDMELPITFEEGYYTLVCYAVIDVDKSHRQTIYCKKKVPVFNDLAEKIALNEGENPFYNEVKLDDSLIFIKFAARRRSNLDIDLKQITTHTKAGEYTISINKYEGLEFDQESLDEGQPVRMLDDIDLGSVRKKILLDGVLKNPVTGKSISEKYLSLYIPFTGRFERIQANSGIVSATLPDMYGMHKAQILSMNPNQRINLDWDATYSYFNTSMLDSREVSLKRSAIINQVLWQNTKRRMIENIFKMSDLAPEFVPDTFKHFKPDKSYVLSDYKDLKTVHNFIREVLIDFRITSAVNDKASLRMRNKDLNELYRWPAWYLKDGFFEGHDSLMFSLDLADVQSIELFNRSVTFENQLDPMMAYTGVMAINTVSKNNLSENVFQLNGLTQESSVPEASLQIATNLPDLRTQLGWMTGLSPDQSGLLHISFNTSDVKGIYTVDLLGMDDEEHTISKRYFIEVR